MIPLNNLPSKFFNTKILALDLETTVLYGKDADPYRDKVLLLSLSDGNNHIVLQPGTWLTQLWKWLKYNQVIIHNGKFDLQFLWSLGFNGYPGKIWDTLIIERILTAGMRLPCGLGDTVKRNCDIELDKSTRDSFKSHISSEFTDKQLKYAIDDVKYLFLIMEKQKQRCKKFGMTETANLENSLVPVVAAMEYRGVNLDVNHWNSLIECEQQTVDKMHNKIVRILNPRCMSFDLFSGEVSGLNLNSDDQVKSALSNIGIHVPNTQESTYLEYLEKNPQATVLSDLIAYGKAVKRISMNYPKYINPITGKIHTSYNQTGARTGRFSSSGPNLQNVVAEQKWRSCFKADNDYFFITADYAQQEMRILAQASDDKNLQDVCRSGDIHLENARRMYNDPTITKKDDRRRIAKNNGFAMAYGAGAENVAKGAGISLKEAKRILTYIQNEFDSVEKWAVEQLNQMRNEGWVSTLGGRRRWFVGLDPAKKWLWKTRARNTPIQGTAGDMLKLGMVYVDEALRKGCYDGRLVLTVHDEIVVEGKNEHKKEIVDLTIQELERAGQHYVSCVPTPVDVIVDVVWRK
jgi:DNA polymerase I-like protein with 3'-5' exonuclease and polymerase domains